MTSNTTETTETIQAPHSLQVEQSALPSLESIDPEATTLAKFHLVMMVVWAALAIPTVLLRKGFHDSPDELTKPTGYGPRTKGGARRAPGGRTRATGAASWRGATGTGSRPDLATSPSNANAGPVAGESAVPEAQNVA